MTIEVRTGKRIGMDIWKGIKIKAKARQRKAMRLD